NRAWRANKRYHWRGYRNVHRNVFRLGRYYAPFRGHYYRPVRIGFFLDNLFFQPRFFINDPWAYRLPPVYGPYRWVRYYDDVLLVDIYTGEVVDVIENFFW
ncbi:MAG: RcnB family protein, partial [Pseudomonadota bacterium]